MKSQELRNLISKIFNDEETRTKFKSNPECVLSQFNLTDQEKKAVLKTHAELGLVTSGSPQLEAALDPTITWSAPGP